MSTRNRNRGCRKVLRRLWSENPYCHYCGFLTEMPKSGVNLTTNFPNMATRDHIFSRLDPRRHDKTNPDRNKCVLSCYRCNHDRNEVEYTGLPKILREALSRKRLKTLHGFIPYYPYKRALTNINFMVT